MSELVLSKYSMGIGDRFGQQGEAQLAAFVEAAKSGIIVSPVWNKSNREHQIVHTEPSSVRAEADSAVKAVGFSGPYHVDADHISIKTVDRFLAWSDFFTLDVADYVGQPRWPGLLLRFGSHADSAVGPGRPTRRFARSRVVGSSDDGIGRARA